MSSEIETRIRDLESRIERVQDEARLCVVELRVDDGARYLVAERLPALGSAILPAIRDLLNDPSTPEEVRVLAALAGFDVGDRSLSLSVLLDQIATISEFAASAARRLAAAGISEAAEAMREVIRVGDISDRDLVVSYLEALHELGVCVGDDEQQRLRRLGAWQVDTALAQWHSSKSA